LTPLFVPLARLAAFLASAGGIVSLSLPVRCLRSWDCSAARKKSPTEAALKGGYEGVREISKRMRYTFGWSATAGAVDNFVYEDANDTYISDERIRKQMLEKNPDALRDMVETFLEANSKGYWETSEEKIEQLKQVYQECEDRIEGVDFTA
jgi:cobalamin biosynthesis Mg chelatase CobN